MNRPCTVILSLISLIVCMMMISCSIDRHISDGDYLLNRVTVSADDEELMKQYALSGYVTQNTNTRWFGARVPLHIYCLAKPDATKGLSGILRRIGEAPVLYDSLVSEGQKADIEKVLANAGYLHARVEEDKSTMGKRMDVEYRIVPGPQYTIRNVTRLCEDDGLRQFVCEDDTASSLIKPGNAFDVNTLSAESKRIVSHFTSNGYYKFTKDNVRFRADTARQSTDVDVTIRVTKLQADGRTAAQPHRPYTVGNVTFVTGGDSAFVDTSAWRGYRFVSDGAMPFRPNLLTSRALLKTGELYSAANAKQMVNYYNRLSAVTTTSLRTVEREGDILDCYFTLNRAKRRSLGMDVEATNSAGDLGAALSASYHNKNLFRGSELFSIKLRGAYEAITGLEGYDGGSYREIGTETKVSFPAFLMPGVKRTWGTEHGAESEIALAYNTQNRPEFNRRVFTAAWRYKWNTMEGHRQHRFDLMEVNYVYMPWISKTFKEQYLDSLGKTNAILKYNYENLLITKTGYTYSYNSLGERERTFGKNAYTVRFNFEASGLPLSLLANALNTRINDDGQRTFCGIAYAQYVRGDFDFAKSIRIDKNNSVALYFALGVAYPYGNSNQLPFEKRYFAGGANSVRGWSVRSLGPGSYKGRDKGINFLNQSGDVKVDLSAEYRAQLFWKLSGALFVDAGNIWTIRDYEDQPGGQFRPTSFFKELAASYGLGLRMDAGFFIVRMDAGMKAVNPAESGRDHYPFTHPNFNRDFAFHFAVGMPF